MAALGGELTVKIDNAQMQELRDIAKQISESVSEYKALLSAVKNED